MAAEHPAASIWDRFEKIGELVAEINDYGANPKVLVFDIQAQLDAIRERLAHGDI